MRSRADRKNQASVGGDAHIAPRGRQARNAIPFGEFDGAQWADVGIGPYRIEKVRVMCKNRHPAWGAGSAYFSLSLMALAACTPEAPACARPLVTPAPSPAAKKFGSAVSRFSVSSSRAE